jgi:hypothetical protein
VGVCRDSFGLWKDERKGHWSDPKRREAIEGLQYGYAANADGQGRPVLAKPSIGSLDW